MIESYKKMKPKAVVVDGYKGTKYTEYRCPICGKVLNHTNNSFCDECKVLFDWGTKTK